MSLSPQRLFCFGLGYSALALARPLLALGWQVAGTCRSEEGQQALARLGIQAFRFSRGHPLEDAAGALAGTTHLLASIPPDEEGDGVIDAYGPQLSQLLPGLVWAGYLSTTGVYGDTGGAWVNEDSSLQPSGPRQARRVQAEAGWRVTGLPLHVFRLAGIYGPGRSVLDMVRNGTAKRIERPGQVFSRIHVEDIATVLRASMARPNPGAIYNVCDDEPAPAHEVVAWACALLDAPLPPLCPFDPATLSPMAASFWRDNRRVSNRRIHAELGITLGYPTYRDGLAAIAALQAASTSATPSPASSGT